MKMYTNKSKTNDEGVSPVVGVILMVALVVILSALLATTVLNIGGTQEPARAGINMAQTPGYGDISYSYNSSIGVCSGQMGGYNVQTTLMTEGNVDKITYASTPDWLKSDSVGESIAYCEVPSGMQVTVIGHANGVSNTLQSHTVQPTDGKTYDVTADVNNPDGKEIFISPESRTNGKDITSTTSFIANGDYTLVIEVDTDGDGVTDTTIGTWDVGSGSTTISGENVDVTITQNGVYCEINSCN